MAENNCEESEGHREIPAALSDMVEEHLLFQLPAGPTQINAFGRTHVWSFRIN